MSPPTLIRRLQLPADDAPERDVALARAAADRAALARLEELVQADGTPREVAEHLRRQHQRQEQHHAARARGEGNREAEEQAAAARELLRAVVEAEQRAVVALRDRPEDSTLNLLGPIVVNRVTYEAAQVVLPSAGYSVRAPLALAS